MRKLGLIVIALLLAVPPAFLGDEKKDETQATSMAIAQDKDGNVVITLAGSRSSVRVDVIENERPQVEMKVTVFAPLAGPSLSTTFLEPKSLTIRGAVITPRKWFLLEDESYLFDQFGNTYSLENGPPPKEEPKNAVLEGTLTCELGSRSPYYTLRFTEPSVGQLTVRRMWRCTMRK